MTIAQMRLFLREGERIQRNTLAQNAIAWRAAQHSDSDGFGEYLEAIKG